MPTLDAMQPGQHGSIETIAGSDALAARLMEMGLTEGEPIEVVAVAPLGDPIEIRVRRYQLSLRKQEAGRVTIRVD
jgi:ferrous iron transport protein A